MNALALPPRLIDQAWARALLFDAIAAVPLGVKLSIPALRDALVSQADVLEGIRSLIGEGLLDAQTLRPAVPAVGTPIDQADEADGIPTGAALAAELDALIADHGLSRMAVSTAVGHGNSGWIEVLRKGSPRRKTVDRVRAFLADPPLDQLKGKPAPFGDRRHHETRLREKRVKPGEAAAVARIAEPLIVKLPVGRKSRSYCQQPKACVAGVKGPCRICHSKKAAPPPPIAVRRDPTQKPDTPLTDLADRQRLNGQRHQANIRRSQEREAAALLDRGVDPSKVKSTFKANTMRQVQGRRDREAQQADPVEQAKLALQRKGLVVYSATVNGGRKDRFIVSGQQNQLTPAELVDLAERKTGESFRRSAA